MWCFASRSNKILVLKFEDFNYKDDKKFAYYYVNKKIKTKNV